jgi:hypothetical protein
VEPALDDKDHRSQNKYSSQTEKATNSVSMWTQANPGYKHGQPILSEEELKAAGLNVWPWIIITWY